MSGRKHRWGEASARRAEELLVTRLTEGLDEPTAHELDYLLRDLPELDVESFELAAAAVELACWQGLESESESEPMPLVLRDRVIAGLGS